MLFGTPLILVDKTSPNFISDIFFLLNSFQHLGLVKTISTRLKAERNISDIEKELKRTETARAGWAGVSYQPSHTDERILPLKLKEKRRLKSSK